MSDKFANLPIKALDNNIPLFLCSDWKDQNFPLSQYIFLFISFTHKTSSKDTENEKMLHQLKHLQQFPFKYFNPLSPRSN